MSCEFLIRSFAGVDLLQISSARCCVVGDAPRCPLPRIQQQWCWGCVTPVTPSPFAVTLTQWHSAACKRLRKSCAKKRIHLRLFANVGPGKLVSARSRQDETRQEKASDVPVAAPGAGASVEHFSCRETPLEMSRAALNKSSTQPTTALREASHGRAQCQLLGTVMGMSMGPGLEVLPCQQQTQIPYAPETQEHRGSWIRSASNDEVHPA